MEPRSRGSFLHKTPGTAAPYVVSGQLRVSQVPARHSPSHAASHATPPPLARPSCFHVCHPVCWLVSPPLPGLITASLPLLTCLFILFAVSFFPALVRMLDWFHFVCPFVSGLFACFLLGCFLICCCFPCFSFRLVLCLLVSLSAFVFICLPSC